MTDAPTLPDYLRPGLDLVFVGINPGAYSASVGKYFATPQNRFWSALNRSGLTDGRELGPGDEAWLFEHRAIGFTDVVKRSSNSASSLRAADFRTWAPLTQKKLLAASPLVGLFQRHHRLQVVPAVRGGTQTGRRCARGAAGEARRQPRIRRAEPEPGERLLLAGRHRRLVPPPPRPDRPRQGGTRWLMGTSASSSRSPSRRRSAPNCGASPTRCGRSRRLARDGRTWMARTSRCGSSALRRRTPPRRLERRSFAPPRVSRLSSCRWRPRASSLPAARPACCG